MTRTRFAPWLVFACIGTLVGCTSGDQGTTGNSELNVVIPSGSSTSGPGAPSSFDIEVVEYTINCVGADFDPTTDPDIDSGDILDQDVSFSGALEVLDTASGGVTTQDFGPDLTEVYVWQAFMDIPANHACTVQLRARDAGGEVICTATEGFNVGADATVKVNVLMICDISYQAPVGMLDLDGDFSFNIGNYCPDLFVLNCVDPDLEEAIAVPGLGAFVYSGCQVRFRDADGTCGDNCDPQQCVSDPSGLSCSPAVGTCVGGDNPGDPCYTIGSPSLDCQGTSPVPDGDCVARVVETTVTCESDAVPFACANPGPAFGTGCDPTAADQGNGDCGLPAPNVCLGGATPGAACNGSNPIQGNADCGLPPPDGTIPQVCLPAVCAPTTVLNCGGASVDPECVFSGDTLGAPGDAPPALLAAGPGGFLVGCTIADDDGNPNTPPVALTPGAAVTCTADTTDGDIDCDKQKTVQVFCPGLTPCQAAGPGFCDDGNDCTADSCNDSSGSAVCEYSNVPADVACTTGSAGTLVPQPAFCDGAGECVSADCNAQPDPDGSCNDGNECTIDSCDAPPATTCSNVPDTGATCDGGNGTCNASGACIDNCVGVDCSDGNACTDDICTSGGGGFTCTNPNNDANSCTTCGGTSCVCSAGACISGCSVPAPVDALGVPMACRNSFNQVVSTFPIDLTNVTASDCLIAGDAVDFDIDPVIALDTAFLQAAAETLCDLGTLLTVADVTSAQVSIDAINGASCTPELSVLNPVPQTVVIDITLVSGSCGAGGVVTVNSGISLPLPPVTLSCTMGASGSDVNICSTGQIPLNITLASPAPPPAYQETFVGVSVGGGQIRVAFACNTSSTTAPAPGVTVECTAPNPTGACAALPAGDVGETPFPVSDCDFSDGFPGSCETVPVGVDPNTVCANFTVD